MTPYPTFLGSTLNLVEMKARGSAYYSLDEDSRYVLAGRVGFGIVTGAALDEIPSNLRFYAGGGGSVRGYQYMSLAPAGPGKSVIGGRSLLDASAELRVKVTDTIGIVPFFDAGNAFASSAPDFKQPLQMAAGLGLRYYTAIGPIRSTSPRRSTACRRSAGRRLCQHRAGVLMARQTLRFGNFWPAR